MEKQKRDLIAAGVLVSVFFLILAKGAFTGKKRPAAAAAVAAVGATDLSFLAAVRENDDRRQAQAAVWERPWKRDPFLAQTSGPGALAVPLKLIGIVWDEKEPYAMVNEKVVKIGDAIEGFRVLEIKQSSVILWSDAGKFHELKLFEESAP